MGQKQDLVQTAIVKEPTSIDECSGTEIKNCQSALTIKQLLATIHHSAQCQRLESEIVSDLKEQQYTEQYIQTALNDTKKRLQWNIQSPFDMNQPKVPIRCRVYSRSTKQWTDGKITDVFTEQKTEKERLTVKYGDIDSKTKEIGRFCSDLKAIGIDDEEYIAEKFKTAPDEQNVHFTKSLIDILEEQFNVVQLLNDIHHLKYDHGVDDNDEKFDEIFEFFTESMTGNECHVNDCDHVQRHYRNRGGPEPVGQGTEYNLLMDTASMIHCCFVHSFDIDRFSKKDRERMAQQKGDKWMVQTDILVEKREGLQYNKNDRRAIFQRDDIGLHFMAKTVEQDARVLQEIQQEYHMERDRLIGDLIDVVFSENEELEKTMSIWNKLNVEDSRKRKIFRLALCGHFNSNELSRDNIVKLSQIIIERKALKINVNAVKDMLNTHEIDGRIFDEKNTNQHQAKGVLANLFAILKNWLFVVYAVMVGLTELKQQEPNTKQFESQIIDFFLQNPIGADELTEMPQNELADRMTESCVVPILKFVQIVVAEKKDPKINQKCGKWQENGDHIVRFFRENPDVDGEALSSMTAKQNVKFQKRVVDHCGINKIKPLAKQTREAVIAKVEETHIAVKHLSDKLLEKVKDRTSKVVDFQSMAKTLGVESKVLSRPLNVYKKHPERLIGALIDVICNENTENMSIWNKLGVGMADHRKKAIFRSALCGHSRCTDLNTANFIKMSEYIIMRKRLNIGIDALNKVARSNLVDGRTLEKGKGHFTKLFDEYNDCDKKHIGELCTLLKRWNVVEIFIEFVANEVLDELRLDKDSKSNAQRAHKFGDQIIDFFRNSDVDYNGLCRMNADEFGKRIANHCDSGNENEMDSDEQNDYENAEMLETETVHEVMGITKALRTKILAKIKGTVNLNYARQHTQTETVYEIGRRFVFWIPEDQDYVKPQYEGGMKQEFMESPLLKDLLSMEEWDRLTKSVQTMLQTKAAQKVRGNGLFDYTDIYDVRKGDALDEAHLRALKLYTDYTGLCEQFCTILRGGDPKKVAQIAHWVKTLTETVQCFGTAIQAKEEYFRGVKQEFMFRMLVSQFYLPLSTTTSVPIYALHTINEMLGFL